MIMRWFKSGSIDHIAKTILDPFPKLGRLYDAVAEEPRIKEWFAKK